VIRRLSTIIFVLSVIAWLLAMAVYVRSKFRDDVITIVTPARPCIIVESRGRHLAITGISPWPGPKLLQWSSAAADVEYSILSPDDQLRGPDFSLLFVAPQRTAAWRGFLIAGGCWFDI
jgi:hypothetical protein